jgi:hypothetical protein
MRVAAFAIDEFNRAVDLLAVEPRDTRTSSSIGFVSLKSPTGTRSIQPNATVVQSLAALYAAKIAGRNQGSAGRRWSDKS